MALNKAKQVIPVLIFFTGLTLIFVIGIGKMPKKMSPDFAEFAGALQRKISSNTSDKRAISTQKAVGESAVKVLDKKTGQLTEPPTNLVTEDDAEDEAASVVEPSLKQPVFEPSVQDRQVLSLAQKNGVCQSFEFRGDGSAKGRVSKQDWAQTVKAFHQSKEMILTWLRSRTDETAKKSVPSMEKLVHDLKIVQPVHAALAEPDLGWRGIGVRVVDDRGMPLLLMGSGFFTLIKIDPKRAAFEMTRLVAQTLNPCELALHKMQQFWSPVLKCLGDSEENVCTPENATESAWGVSSSLASYLSAPGCQLPALLDLKRKACLETAFGPALRLANAEPQVSKVSNKELISVPKRMKK